MFFRESISAMSGYTPGEQPKDRPFIKLNTNENPYPPSAAVKAAIAALDLDRLNRYPRPTADGVRDAIGELYDVSRNWVLAGNGSDDILTIVMRCFVDQGGLIAYPDPTYSLYPVLAAIQGAGTVEIPLESDFSLPRNLLKKAAGASLLFLARPNAPTGVAYPLAAVERLCEEFDGIVLIDEAYADFAEDNCIGLALKYDNVIVSRTLSKSYSLAGVRFGYALANPELIAGMLKVKDSYNVNAVTQVVAEAAIRDQEAMLRTVALIKTTRERVAKRLAQLGFGICPSAANFLFVKPPAPLAAAAYVEALREADILVRYFSYPRTRDHARITIGTDAEMDRLIAATEAILNQRG